MALIFILVCDYYSYSVSMAAGDAARVNVYTLTVVFHTNEQACVTHIVTVSVQIQHNSSYPVCVTLEDRKVEFRFLWAVSGTFHTPAKINPVDCSSLLPNVDTGQF